MYGCSIFLQPVYVCAHLSTRQNKKILGHGPPLFFDPPGDWATSYVVVGFNSKTLLPEAS